MAEVSGLSSLDYSLAGEVVEAADSKSEQQAVVEVLDL